MIRRPPRSTRTDTLFPYTTLFRSGDAFALYFIERFYQTFDSHFCELGDFETVGIDASARFPHDLVRLVDVGDTEFVSEAELVRHRSEDMSSKSVKGIDVNIPLVDPRSEERRVGKVFILPCQTRL